MTKTMPQNDVVIDANVMAIYGTSAAGPHLSMFAWLTCCGGLCISRAVIKEYTRQGSPLVAALIDSLTRSKRCSFIKNSTIKAFAGDANYTYTSNMADRAVARTTFRSFRKILVSLDERLRNDVNGFPLVNGVQPQAFRIMPIELLVAHPLGVCAADVH